MLEIKKMTMINDFDAIVIPEPPGGIVATVDSISIWEPLPGYYQSNV